MHATLPLPPVPGGASPELWLRRISQQPPLPCSQHAALSQLPAGSLRRGSVPPQPPLRAIVALAPLQQERALQLGYPERHHLGERQGAGVLQAHRPVGPARERPAAPHHVLCTTSGSAAEPREVAAH